MNLLLPDLVLFAILDRSPPELEDFLYMDKPLTFLKEVRVELEKVVWPSRNMTIKLTFMVVLVVIFTGLFIGGIDYLLAQGTSLILK